MKIKEIRLLTDQPEQLKNFYHQVLGFELIHDTDALLGLKCGNSTLTFVRETGAAENYYHFAFNISENKFQQAIGFLKGRDVVINPVNGKDSIHFSHWNADSVYFYDPKGNILEFIARHSLEGKAGKIFTIDDIENISEIGLPTHRVDEVSKLLQSQLGERVYVSGDTNFTPIGDEEGLFILTSPDRTWLGSDKKVKGFPVKVTIESKRKGLSNFFDLPYNIITK